jgi:hypothetical protein
VERGGRSGVAKPARGYSLCRAPAGALPQQQARRGPRSSTPLGSLGYVTAVRWSGATLPVAFVSDAQVHAANHIGSVVNVDRVGCTHGDRVALSCFSQVTPRPLPSQSSTRPSCASQDARMRLQPGRTQRGSPKVRPREPTAGLGSSSCDRRAGRRIVDALPNSISRMARNVTRICISRGQLYMKQAIMITCRWP